MPNDKMKFYKALSHKYDAGTFEEFNKRTEDPAFRKKIYKALSEDYDTGTFEDFNSRINRSDKGALGAFDDVADAMKVNPSSKKKSTTASPSGQNQGGVSSATSTMETKKPSVSSGSVDRNLFRGDAGAGEQTYRLDKSSGVPVWKEYSSTMVDYSGKKPQYDVYDKPITDPTRVKTLNKFFKQNASASEVEEVFTGFPGKEANRYRVFNGSWQRMQPNAKEWTTINEDNAVTALNRQFKKDIKPIKGLNVIKEGAKFTDINTKLVSQTEGNVVPYLQKKYSKLGFKFEESRIGQDYVTVTSKDGNTVDVSLDEANPEEALKLRHFISQNASVDHSQKTKYLKAKREEDPNYVNTSEYINALKSLSPDEVEDLIDERKSILSKNLSDASFVDDYKGVRRAKEGLNNFYNSEEYKIYKEKKSEKQKERATKVDKLYYELNNAKTAKDKQYIKSKINTFLSDDIIQKQTDGYNMQLMDVQNAYKKINSEYTNLNSAAASGKLTEEQYNAQLDKLNQKRVNLKESSDGVISQMKKLEKVTGKYLLDKEKMGSFGGNILNGVAGGLSKIIETPATFGSEAFRKETYEALPPEEKKFILDKIASNKNKSYDDLSEKEKSEVNKQAINYVANKSAKEIKSDIREGFIGAIGTKETTKEYAQSKDRGFFETALVGVAESLPAMLIPGGGVVRTIAMGSQAYASIEDEMLNDPDFETTSMTERSLIAAPYAIGMGLLENFGFTKMISKDPLAKSLVMKSINTVLSKKATAETLESSLEKELKSNIAKFGLKVVGGTLAEAETGALQSAILDIGFKTTYNQIRNLYEGKSAEEISKLTGGGYLETPDNLKEAGKQILEDAAAEAIGGTVMTAALTGFEKLSNGEITLFNDDDITKLKDLSKDPEMKKMFVAKLRTDMVEGKITKEQAKTKLEALRSVESDFTRIPDEITGPDLRRAVKLSIEKKELTKEIEGKDENLVAPKKARIEEINNELKTIGENATKESNKQEVSAEGDILQREGTDEGQQEVGQGEGAVGQTEKSGADTGDSNIPSQEEVDYTPEDKSRLDEINVILSKDMISATNEDIESMISAGKEKTEIENKYGLNDVELKHGTPHDFNKFETEKIGTGEGAQAFGYGLYFTENSKIAKGYADKLSKDKSGIIYTVKIKNGKKNNWLEWREPVDASQAVELSKVLKSKKEKYNEYLNSIDDEKSHTGAAEKLFEDNLELDDYRPISNASLYNDLSDAFGQNEASKIMSEAGIDGVKYKTRQGKGSDFNYVVFNPKTITITKKETTSNTTEAQQPVTETIVEEGPTFDEVKSLDTKDATNLKKALDFITGIEESLDKFGKETLGVNLTIPIAKAVVKSVKVLLQAGVTLEQAIKQAAADNNVSEKDVTDTIFSLSEAKQRAARERITGEKQTKPKQTTASQSAKDISKRKSTKVTVDEMSALKDQIKLEAKAAKEKGKQIKEILKDISQTTKELVKKGTITLKQQSAIQNKLASVNFDSQASIEKYIDYIDRKFNKANLSYKVNEGYKTRASIKEKTKNAQGHFIPVAKNFSSINPNMVEDIDEYNRIAELVLGSVTKARTVGEELISAEEADINEVSEYTEKALERQEKINNDRLIQRYANINELTFDEASQIDIKEIKEGLANATFKEKFSPEKARENIIEEIENQKENIDEDSDERIKKISKFNLDLLDNKRLLEIIDAFDSYFANDAITNLDKIVSEYEGIEALNNFKSPSRKLNFVFSKPLGRRKDRNLTNLNMIIEKIFPGQSNANKFKEASGLNDLINGSNKAENERNKKEDQYLNKYKKIKDFFSAENIFERGVVATLNRQLSDGDNNTYFKDRVRILLNSVNEMKKSVDPAVKRSAAIYEKVYEKLGLNDENVSIESINKKAESFNKEAVNDIIDMFGEIYPDLYELNLSMYNTQLSKDINYTPDNYRNTGETDKFDDSLLASGFNQFNNNNNVKLDKNKAGVLMDTSRPANVAEGSYLDLNFESNVFRSYGLALNDLYTAKAIAKADAFMNSDKNKFNELFNNSADANLVRNAFKDYVNSKKGKSEFIDADERIVNKFADTIGAFSSARALAGVGQAVAQFSTAMSNTIVQAGEHIRFGDLTDTDFWEKISEAGLPISNVSADALTNLRKVNTKMKRAITKGTVVGKVSDVTLKSLLGVNKFMLKWTLQKPDRAARLVTFAAFYRKYMSDNNIVDNGEINKDAANYAQSMTDRTMDVTDTDLRGKLFTSESGAANYIKNVLFPFASFRLNQRARLTVDLKNAFAKSTKINDGDRAAAVRSLIGTSVEIATYNYIRYNISKAIIYAAFNALGYDDDEIDEMTDKLIGNIKKSIVSNAITDVLSPIPEADQYILELSNKILKFTKLSDPSEKQINDFIDKINKIRQANDDPTLTEDEKSDKIKKFKEDKQFQLYIDSEKTLGKYGIQMERLSELVDLAKTYATGEYKDEYQGRVTEKILTDKGRESLKYALISKAAGATIGLREFNMFSDKTFKIIKDKEGLTSTRKEKYDVVKEKYKNIDAYKKSLIESSMKVDKIMEYIEYIEDTGGFTKSQSKEYVKLIKDMPVDYYKIDKIRDGITADEILNNPD